MSNINKLNTDDSLNIQNVYFTNIKNSLNSIKYDNKKENTMNFIYDNSLVNINNKVKDITNLKAFDINNKLKEIKEYNSKIEVNKYKTPSKLKQSLLDTKSFNDNINNNENISSDNKKFNNSYLNNTNPNNVKSNFNLFNKSSKFNIRLKNSIIRNDDSDYSYPIEDNLTKSIISNNSKNFMFNSNKNKLKSIFGSKLDNIENQNLILSQKIDDISNIISDKVIKTQCFERTNNESDKSNNFSKNLIQKNNKISYSKTFFFNNKQKKDTSQINTTPNNQIVSYLTASRNKLKLNKILLNVNKQDDYTASDFTYKCLLGSIDSTSTDVIKKNLHENKLIDVKSNTIKNKLSVKNSNISDSYNIFSKRKSLKNLSLTKILKHDLNRFKDNKEDYLNYVLEYSFNLNTEYNSKISTIFNLINKLDYSSSEIPLELVKTIKSNLGVFNLSNTLTYSSSSTTKNIKTDNDNNSYNKQLNQNYFLNNFITFIKEEFSCIYDELKNELSFDMYRIKNDNKILETFNSILNMYYYNYSKFESNMINKLELLSENKEDINKNNKENILIKQDINNKLINDKTNKKLNKSFENKQFLSSEEYSLCIKDCLYIFIQDVDIKIKHNNALDKLFLDFCEFLKLKSIKTSSFLVLIWNLKTDILSKLIFFYKNNYERMYMLQLSLKISIKKLEENNKSLLDKIKLKDSYFSDVLVERDKLKEKLYNMEIEHNRLLLDKSTYNLKMKDHENKYKELVYSIANKKKNITNSSKSNEKLLKINSSTTESNINSSNKGINIDYLIKLRNKRLKLSQKLINNEYTKKQALLFNSLPQDNTNLQSNKKNTYNVRDSLKKSSITTTNYKFCNCICNLDVYNNNNKKLNYKNDRNSIYADTILEENKTTNNFYNMDNNIQQYKSKSKSKIKFNELRLQKSYTTKEKSILVNKEHKISTSNNMSNRYNRKKSISPNARQSLLKQKSFIKKNYLSKGLKLYVNKGHIINDKNYLNSSTQTDIAMTDFDLNIQNENDKNLTDSKLNKENELNSKLLKFNKFIKNYNKDYNYTNNNTENLDKQANYIDLLDNNMLVNTEQNKDTNIVDNNFYSNIEIIYKDISIYANKLLTENNIFTTQNTKLKDINDNLEESLENTRETYNEVLNLISSSIDNKNFNTDLLIIQNDSLRADLNLLFSKIKNQHTYISNLEFMLNKLKNLFKFSCDTINKSNNLDLINEFDDKIYNNITELNNYNYNINSVYLNTNDVNLTSEDYIKETEYLLNHKKRFEKQSNRVNKNINGSIKPRKSILFENNKLSFASTNVLNYNYKNSNKFNYLDKIKKGFKNICSEYMLSSSILKLNISFKKTIKIINTILFDIIDQVYFKRNILFGTTISNTYRYNNKFMLNKDKDLDNLGVYDYSLNINFENILRIYFINIFGLETLAKKKYIEFLKALNEFKYKHKRIQLFIKFIDFNDCNNNNNNESDKQELNCITNNNDMNLKNSVSSKASDTSQLSISFRNNLETNKRIMSKSQQRFNTQISNNINMHLNNNLKTNRYELNSNLNFNIKQNKRESVFSSTMPKSTKIKTKGIDYIKNKLNLCNDNNHLNKISNNKIKSNKKIKNKNLNNKENNSNTNLIDCLTKNKNSNKSNHRSSTHLKKSINIDEEESNNDRIVSSSKYIKNSKHLNSLNSNDNTDSKNYCLETTFVKNNKSVIINDKDLTNIFSDIKVYDNFTVKQILITIQLIKEHNCIIKGNISSNEQFSDIYLSISKLSNIIDNIVKKFNLNLFLKNKLTNFIEDNKLSFNKNSKVYNVIDFDDFIEFLAELFQDVKNIYSINLSIIFKAVDIEQKGYLNFIDLLLCFEYIFKANNSKITYKSLYNDIWLKYSIKFNTKSSNIEDNKNETFYEEVNNNNNNNNKELNNNNIKSNNINKNINEKINETEDEHNSSISSLENTNFKLYDKKNNNKQTNLDTSNKCLYNIECSNNSKYSLYDNNKDQNEITNNIKVKEKINNLIEKDIKSTNNTASLQSVNNTNNIKLNNSQLKVNKNFDLNNVHKKEDLTTEISKLSNRNNTNTNNIIKSKYSKTNNILLKKYSSKSNNSIKDNTNTSKNNSRRSTIKSSKNLIKKINNNNKLLKKNKLKSFKKISNKFIKVINNKGFMTYEAFETMVIEHNFLERMHFFEFLKTNESEIMITVSNFQKSILSGGFYVFDNLKKRISIDNNKSFYNQFIINKIETLKNELTINHTITIDLSFKFWTCLRILDEITLDLLFNYKQSNIWGKLNNFERVVNNYINVIDNKEKESSFKDNEVYLYSNNKCDKFNNLNNNNNLIYQFFCSKESYSDSNSDSDSKESS